MVLPSNKMSTYRPNNLQILINTEPAFHERRGLSPGFSYKNTLSKLAGSTVMNDSSAPCIRLYE